MAAFTASLTVWVGPLLSIRTALILLIAIVIGLVAGALGYFASGEIAAAALIGGGGSGGSLALFHTVLDRR